MRDFWSKVNQNFCNQMTLWTAPSCCEKSSGLFARRLHTWPCHMVLAIEETCSAVRWDTQSLCLVNGVLKIELDWHLREYVIIYMVVGSPSAVWFSGTLRQRTVIPNRITKKLLSHREKCMVYLLSFSYILWVNVPRYIDSYGRMV